MKRAAAIAVAAIALAGCGGGVKSGVVVAKHDQAAYMSHDREATYGQDCGLHYAYGLGFDGKYSYGYHYTCNSVVTGYHVVAHFHPEKWSLELENAKGKTGWVTVSRATYDATNAGSEYSR